MLEQPKGCRKGSEMDSIVRGQEERMGRAWVRGEGVGMETNG